jgi:cytochrome c553
MSLPAAHAYEEGRLVDGVLGPNGDVCKGEKGVVGTGGDGNHPCDDAGQGRLIEPFVPLEGNDTGVFGRSQNGKEGYAENIVMCLTCHVAHGSGSEKLQVAYKNYGLNNTDASNLQRNADTNYLEVLPRPSSAPSNWWENPQNLVSSALARFNPMASVCYRCHSTTPDSAYIDYPY